MKLLLLLPVIVTSMFVYGQDKEKAQACPLSSKEAYILHVTYEKDVCEITQKQSDFILSLRRDGKVENTYHYVQRLNAEMGVFTSAEDDPQDGE